MLNNNILNRIREQIQNVDGIFVFSKINLRYIFGKEIECYAYITNENVYILVYSIYLEEVKRELANDAEIINLSKLEEVKNFKEKIIGKRIGFDPKEITVKKYNSLKEQFEIDLIEKENIVENIRAIKNEEELSYIKKACEITANAFEYICTYIKVGMTEKEVRDELERKMKELGATGLAFDTIVASGSNSSEPHAIPSDRKIEKEDIVLMDFGCSYNGYASDMTRTIFVGNATDKQKEIYELVLKAKRDSINLIKEYAEAKDIDILIRKYFDEKGLEEKYIHAAGHGVGLEVHENPVINKNIEYILKENMVLAIEPGIYFENEFGIRIEDTVLVTKEGVEILTKNAIDSIILV